MSEKLIGYKVVKVDEDGRFLSCVWGNMEYVIGRKTIPDSWFYGPLAIFDTLEHSQMFLAGLIADYDLLKRNFRILKVEYTKSNHQELWVGYNSPTTGFYNDNYQQTTTAYKNNKQILKLDDCPVGTILAASVTPIEIVE